MQSYLVAKIVTALVQPIGTALALSLLSLLALGIGARRLAAASLISAVAWLSAWSMPAVSTRFAAAISTALPAPAETYPTADAIVVLGGSVLSEKPAGAGRIEANGEVDRMFEAARLYRAGKAPVVVLTGGNSPFSDLPPEADAMHRVMIELGVPQTALVVEDRSANTAENAAFASPLLREMGAGRILLVTSAVHMRRGVRLFEAEGFEVVPAAADLPIVRPLDDPLAFVPDSQALDESSRAIKEVVGNLVLDLLR